MPNRLACELLSSKLSLPIKNKKSSEPEAFLHLREWYNIWLTPDPINIHTVQSSSQLPSLLDKSSVDMGLRATLALSNVRRRMGG